ncbi:DUF1800 family protein [Silvibacterium dinghuense]|uniref:DUF1800 family protein n=1 Tax=Silvibacterium dinghuense TaxID=1560006 RepID=UPI0013E92C2D|nr:DUF1800 family protein [Silvibacterium dinghuense]GGH12379.1 hypothetical protein GCM10011586_31610 [Silvibacterium dinghuense]
MQLTATSGQGVNPTTACLGRNTTFTAALSGVAATDITWGLDGAGSITSAGLYTAPDTMPSSPTVTVTATSGSATVSYTMTLINPTPAIVSTTPASVTAGTTNAVVLNGSGFVSGTKVLVNGTAVTTTYQSIYHVTAQIPVAASATTGVTITTSNPSPGGGTSNALTLPLSSAAIKLTATSGIGVNPTTAALGRNTALVATVSGTTSTDVTWSLSGAGSITSAGLYTAPETMPSSTTVTVTAALSSQPSVTASYTMTLINPTPAIVSTTPAVLTAGTTNTVILNGSGFVPGTKILVNGTAVTTSYQSIYHVSAQIPVALNATSGVTLTTSNPSPGGGVSNAYSLPLNNVTIKLTGTSGIGVNPTTAALGRNTSFVATVSGTTSTAVTWSLTGAGSITSAGIYTAPETMPTSTAVTVTATLTSEPSVTASSMMTLINPTPAIVSTTPASINPGTTNTVILNGSGFIPGTKVLVNGTAVTTTYQSIYHVTAQIPVAANATSGVSITTSNASPGGGISNALSLPLSAVGIKITATSGQGVNPATAVLGRNTTFTSTVSGTSDTAVTWSLSGPGTITSAGLYTAPNTMPSTTTATVTATLTSEPSVTATYAMTLVNPVVSITGTTPASLGSATNTVVLNGYGYIPSSVVLVNGTAVPTTYQSMDHVTAQITATAGETNSVSITVQNPSPGGGLSPAYSLPVAVPGLSSVSPSQVPTGATTLTVTGVNFTTGTTVYLNGNPVTTTYVSPTTVTAVAHVAPWSTGSLAVGISSSSTAGVFASLSLPIQNQTTISYDAAARFSAQAAFGPRPDVVAQIQQLGFSGFLTQQFAQPVSTYPTPVPLSSNSSQSQFTLNALQGSNLLRQRVAFALEEFIAVSVIDNNVYQTGVPWQLLMEKDAFGNFRDLMTDVTLNSTMGVWLNLGNNWAPTSSSVHPNQNYAREFMQLFTIGPVMLNMDGSEVLDSSGNPEPSYDTATVLDLSRALTGWALPAADSSNFSISGVDYSLPMQAEDSKHDHGEKTLFDTTVLPAGQTITQDLTSALDAVFNHQNTAPFVSKLLIQHLVKSNPTPAYIARISAVFADNGQGVRGDLKAVVQAILLDPEARRGDTGTMGSLDGNIQEPILYYLNIMSGLQIAPTAQNFVLAEQNLGQYLWEPDSVFSYYSPSYMIPTTSINSPEYELFNGNLLVQRSQILYNILNGTQTDFSGATYRNTDWFFTYFSTVPDILDAVNHMYFHDTMPAATITAIESYCATLSTLKQQQTTALYLALNSDSFQVAH